MCANGHANRLVHGVQGDISKGAGPQGRTLDAGPWAGNVFRRAATHAGRVRVTPVSSTAVARGPSATQSVGREPDGLVGGLREEQLSGVRKPLLRELP